VSGCVHGRACVLLSSVLQVDYNEADPNMPYDSDNEAPWIQEAATVYLHMRIYYIHTNCVCV
jgi:hypothetical protein